MRHFPLLLLLLSLNFSSLHAQSDSMYYIRFTDYNTRETVPWCKVEWNENDSVRRWYSHFDGIARIPVSEFKSPGTITFYTRAQGYAPAEKTGVPVKPGDTLEIMLKPADQMLDEITVVSYCVPRIDRDLTKREQRRQAKLPVPFDSSAFYLANAQATYDSIADGAWFTYNNCNVNLSGNQFYQYMEAELKYPEFAETNCLEETIYFKLSVNAEGVVESIELLRGSSAFLVIEAAEALSKICVLENPYHASPAIYTISVRFMLG